MQFYSTFRAFSLTFEHLLIKRPRQNITFAEMDLKGPMEHNRSLKMMRKINHTIDWSKIEPVFMEHYSVGTIIDE